MQTARFVRFSIRVIIVAGLLIAGLTGAIGAFFNKTTYFWKQSANFKGGGKWRRAAGVLCASLLLTPSAFKLVGESGVEWYSVLALCYSI